MIRLFRRSAAPTTDTLGGESAAATFCSTLPADDPGAALDSVRKRIDDEMARGRMLGASGIGAMLYLDAAATPFFDRVVQQYLQGSRMPQAWQAEQILRLQSYVAAMLKPYMTFLQDMSETQMGSAPPPDATVKALLPQTLARGLRYLGWSVKLDYFHNLIPDQKLWRRVHRLYRLAEHANISRKLVTGRFPPTTCEDEWIRIVMLATVNQGSLKPRQIEQVSLWLEALSIHIVPESRPDAHRHQYFSDLDSSSPALRFSGEPAQGEGRYWGTSELLYRLGEQRKALQSTQAMALTGLASHELLQRIHQWWTPETTLIDLRSMQRLQAEGEQLVVGGLEDIVVTLKNLPVAQKRGKVESWRLRDLSDNGLGLAVRLNHPWARLTTLMLVSTYNESWQLAVVRRVAFERDASEGQLGLQWLSQSIQLVRLENTGLSGGTSNKAFAIFIDPNLDAPNPGSLVLPVAAYRAGAQVNLAVPDEDSMGVFRLDDVLVQGEDWVMAKISRSRL